MYTVYRHALLVKRYACPTVYSTSILSPALRSPTNPTNSSMTPGHAASSLQKPRLGSSSVFCANTSVWSHRSLLTDFPYRSVKNSSHQSSQGAVESHADVWLTEFQPAERGCRQGAGCCRQVGDEGHTGEAATIHGGGGAGIETEPAQPEDEDTHRGQGHAVADDRV